MPYTRESPSARYRDLIGLYRTMHLEGEKFLDISAEDTFPGSSLPPQVSRIKRLIDATGATSILDYGSGKGRQYDMRDIEMRDGRVISSIADHWNVDYVHCYDPGYPPFSRIPEGKFDGVISTDVLEHCPEEDIPWIVEEIFAYATKFVFANVACYPARKRLPTGENAHCTVLPPQWWADLVRSVAASRADLAWEFWILTREDGPDGPRRVENRIGSDGGS